MAYNASQVINGTFTSVWLDDQDFPEMASIEATLEADVEDVAQAGTLEKGHKVTGMNGTGTLTLNHVYSDLKNQILSDLNSGRFSEHTMTVQNADPDSPNGQVESYTLSGVIFTSVGIVNAEVGSLGTSEFPFSFKSAKATSAINRV